MKSESIEDYLKAIYLILESQNGSPVSTTSLASQLGISNASVTGMLKRLSTMEPALVKYEPYYGVSLSPEGYRSALEIIRHHRLIESYLSQKLGYTWDEVHAEAERLEHVISEDLEERLAIALGNPSTDPHGDPIPDRNGTYRQLAYQPLADIPDGQLVEVCRVIGQKPEMLRYLTELGLVLTSKVEVVSKAPFNGPITIRFVDSRSPVQVVGREVAEKIFVLPISTTITEQHYE